MKIREEKTHFFYPVNNLAWKIFVAVLSELEKLTTRNFNDMETTQLTRN